MPIAFLVALFFPVAGGLKATTRLPGYTAAATEACAPCDAEDQGYVAFCAREESAWGHCFVLLGEGNGYGSVEWAESWGLYPTTGIGLPGAVPRIMSKEDPWVSMERMTHRLRVRVDAAQQAQVRAILAGYESPGAFRVMGTDCVEMLEAVAGALELTVPARTLNPMPQAWVRELIRLNDGD